MKKLISINNRKSKYLSSSTPSLPHLKRRSYEIPSIKTPTAELQIKSSALSHSLIQKRYKKTTAVMKNEEMLSAGLKEVEGFQ